MINLNMAIPPQPSIIAGTNNLPTGRLIACRNALINPRVDEFYSIVGKGSVHQEIERRIRLAHKREVVVLALKALAGTKHNAPVGQ